MSRPSCVGFTETSELRPASATLAKPAPRCPAPSPASVRFFTFSPSRVSRDPTPCALNSAAAFNAASRSVPGMKRLTARRANPQVGTCDESQGFDAHQSRKLRNTTRNVSAWLRRVASPQRAFDTAVRLACVSDRPKLDRPRATGAVARRGSRTYGPDSRKAHSRSGGEAAPQRGPLPVSTSPHPGHLNSAHRPSSPVPDSQPEPLGGSIRGPQDLSPYRCRRRSYYVKCFPLGAAARTCLAASHLRPH